jgi:PAS domain S-box-containing protein
MNRQKAQNKNKTTKAKHLRSRAYALKNALRKKAEERLSKQTSKPLHDLSASDSLNLIHELQVHQIELEMQNEELRAAQVELEKSRSIYSDLYDYAPVGYFTLDNKGIITGVNLTGSAQLGLERGSLLKKTFTMFIHKNDQDTFYLHRQKVFKNRTKLSCEVRLKRNDKIEFYAQLVSTAFKDSDDNYSLMRLAVINISERRRAEIALRESEERWRSITENSPDYIMTLDSDANIEFINRTVPELNRDEVIGTSIYKYVDNEYKAVMKKCFEHVLGTGKPDMYEIERVGADGIKRSFESRVGPIINSGKVVAITVSSSDITERKNIEEELRDSQNKLETRVRERTLELEKTNVVLSAEIHERKRIAKELQEINTALKVLLKQRDKDRVEIEQNIISNIKSLVQPYLDRLKNSRVLKDHLTYLNIIESNLNEIISPFSNKLSSAYMNFSPREIQVANLIKEGRRDKDIMEILNISFETVKTHRQNIRKKLGIYGTNANLKTRLRAIIN